MSIDTKHEIIWKNVVFFAITILVALVGTPLYIINFGLSLPVILLFISYMVLTGLGVTVGYHRLFAHSTFHANVVIRFIVLFFGAAAFEQSALKWASQHRDHHRYVDTDKDPYNIKKGFFYAHMGWMLVDAYHTDYENAKDLQKSRLLMHQHRYYGLWALAAGVVVPVLIGALSGHALGAFIIAVCLRLFLVHQTTFCINSVCHMFGRSTYDIYASAKDHWAVAFLTYGEGYHNFHHRFPTDYRNGVRWYQWDPSKWVIFLLSRLGFAWDVRRVSHFRILEARLAAEHQRVNDYLVKFIDNPRVREMTELCKVQYNKVRQSFIAWENAAKEHQRIFQEKASHHSSQLHKAALDKVQASRESFQKKFEEFRLALDEQFSGLGLQKVYSF